MAVARLTHFLFLPLGCAGALAVLSLLPALAGQTRLRWTFLAAAVFLGAWNGLLLARARRRRRLPPVTVALRPQHYIQACAQGALLLYWGWYWREVYDAAHLLAAQLLFAWSFDLLLSWTRRDTCALSLGTLPIVFSINLFLWFRADWFFLQFLLIAVGLVVKELWRRERDGRRVHVFNPSSFPLALGSLGLVATGTTDLTWGQEIATTLDDAPHIYLAIFLVSLPGQIRFGVAWTTLSAVVTMYLFGLVHLALIGTYYFVDAYIPIAVFLGMHLLVTDPATSPRTAPGRVVFGAAYALSVIALYGLLGFVGAPQFYDKLLAVPVLNLLVPAIERLVRARAAGRSNREPTRIHPGVDNLIVRPAGGYRFAALRHWMSGARFHLASVGLWTIVFTGMSGAGGVGDSHRGQWVTFWERACAEDLPNACRHFAVLVSTYCDRGSGWACNEYGVLVQPAIRPALADEAFQRACNLGFAAGCANLRPGRADPPARSAPELADYAIVLRFPKGARPAPTLLKTYRLACDQGFADGCRQACDRGDRSACAPRGSGLTEDLKRTIRRVIS